MYINNQIMKEADAIAQIRRFISNNTNYEYITHYTQKGVIILRQLKIGNDTYQRKINISCTERQLNKIIDIFNYYNI